MNGPSRVDWHPEMAIAAVGRAREHAEERGGDAVLAQALQRVPFDTGRLAHSGRVDRGERGVVVSFSAAYARVLHAHPEWNFRGGRSGHWLDLAVNEAGGNAGQAMAETLRSEWPGG